MWILKQIFFYVKIVWRQSEFAFFVRSLRLTHFFYLEEKMKKKKLSKLIIAIVVLLLSFSLILSACANNDNTTPNTPDDNQIVQPDDQDKNQPSTPTPEPPEVLPTADEIATKLHNFYNENEQFYNFKINLSGNLSMLGIGGTANGNYEALYRYNNSTKNLQFQRSTSGLLFYDSTSYIFSQGDSKVKVKQDENGNIKKVELVLEEDTEIDLLNIPFVAIINACNSENFSTIKKSELIGYKYQATINAKSSNSLINKLLEKLMKMDSKINIKDVAFTNPTAVPFYFNLKDGSNILDDYKFEFDIDFPIKGITAKLKISYEQKKDTLSINTPNISNYKMDKTQISTELNTINSAFNKVMNSETYSLDLQAVNEFDPGWNHFAIKDSFISRLYKNTYNSFTAFNNSYEYKTHHETDGKETYKFTLGNIVEDSNTYLVSRKGANTVTIAPDKNLQTQFDYMTNAFKFIAQDIDCIKKEIKDGKTIYSVYLNKSNTISVKDKICDMINSNDADGVIDVDNYFNNSEYEIDKADMTLEMVEGNLYNISIATELRYNPTGGEHTDSKILLENTLILSINENLDKAQKYKAPEKAEGSILGLESANKYIL